MDGGVASMRFPMNEPAGAPRVLRSAMSSLWVLFFIAMSYGRTAKMICGSAMLTVGFLVSATAIVQRRRARRLGRCLEVTDTGLSLYAPSWFDDVHLILPWTSIGSITRIGSRRRFVHLHTTDGKMYSIAANTLATPKDLPELVDAIEEAVARSPGGPTRLEQSRADQARADAILARRTPATWMFAAICTFVFLGEMETGALGGPTLDVDPFGLLRWGANAPLLVRHGEWFRLLTANLLHGSGAHLGMNLLSFLVVGFILEKILGTSRVVILTLVTGATGALASCLAARAVLSVGASTAIFGLLGALAVVQFLGDVPRIFRGRRNAWIFVAVANIALPYFMPSIDWVGHLGGLAGGVVLARLLVRPNMRIEPARLHVHLSAALCVALYLAAIGQAAFDAHAHTTRPMFLHALAEAPPLRPEEVNDFVWATVIDPNATPDELGIALTLSRRSLVHAAANDVDTAALTEHRNGHDAEALALEVRAMEGGIKKAPTRVVQYANNLPPVAPSGPANRPAHLVVAIASAAHPEIARAVIDACAPPSDVAELVASARDATEIDGDGKLAGRVLFSTEPSAGCPTSIEKQPVQYAVDPKGSGLP